jgi:hypothetical protein
MYDRIDSLEFCTQALTSSIDVGRLYVDLKFLINWYANSKKELHAMHGCGIVPSYYLNSLEIIS